MKKKPLMIFFAVLAGVAILVPEAYMPSIVKASILLALGALFLYFQRSFLFFAQANRELMKPSPRTDKVWTSYKKACAAGLPAPRIVSVANAFIQRGDAAYGRELLHRPEVEELEDKTLKNQIQLILSMADTREGNMPQAIERLQALYEEGVREKTLFINLTTYLLAEGFSDKADLLLAEADEAGLTSPGLDDNKGWSAILQDKWDEAAEIYDALLEGSGPGFPEAYLHAAQVRFHLNLVEDGIALLGLALTKRFSYVTGADKDVIQQMIDRLADEQADTGVLLRNLDEQKARVAAGKSPW